MRATNSSSTRKTKRGRWSRADQARLRQLFGLHDEAAIARLLKRPLQGVLRMANSLFPPHVKKTGPWTSSETLELKHYLGATTPQVIARILGRSIDEVQEKISDLGRIKGQGSLTREEMARFKRIYGTRTDEDLALIFERGEAEIRRLALEQRLSKDKAFMRKLAGEAATRMPRWKQEELDAIRRDYPNQPNVELARRLGRSVKSVVSKANRMRLCKSADRLHEMGRENVSARYS